MTETTSSQWNWMNETTSSQWNLDVSWLSICSFSHGCAQRGVVLIAAHDSRVAALAFSPAGDKIATASEKVCLAVVLFLISTATMYMCVCVGGGGGVQRIVWPLMVGFFNICTDINACDCTHLLHKHHQKVCTQGEKTLRNRTCISSTPDPAHNQLSYKNSDIQILCCCCCWIPCPWRILLFCQCTVNVFCTGNSHTCIWTSGCSQALRVPTWSQEVR